MSVNLHRLKPAQIMLSVSPNYSLIQDHNDSQVWIEPSKAREILTALHYRKVKVVSYDDTGSATEVWELDRENWTE